MAVLNSLTKIVAKPIPRIVSRKTHAMVDYANVGLFLGTAALFWRRNRRAAMASLICGGAELALVLLTDYPGGVNKVISFSTHRELDYSLAAMAASMPESLAFEGHDETKFFRVQGALITLLGELTQNSGVPVKTGANPRRLTCGLTFKRWVETPAEEDRKIAFPRLGRRSSKTSGKQHSLRG